MRTVRVTGKTGPDGVLHVSVPVGMKDTEYEVIVVFEAKAAAPPGSPESRGWPPGFIEQTAGAWQGEFERPPQGECDKRLGFE
jgi:hypothetical protein